jgi:hypothetical protein
MPYIKKIQRSQLDFEIHQLSESIRRIQSQLIDRPGLVNYAITRVVLQSLKPEGGWSYHSISRALGVLRDAEAEMRRRLMDAREDEAIKENGDVIEYEREYPHE